MFSSRFTEVIVISKNLYKVSGDVVVQGIASCEGLCYSLTSMKQIKFDVNSRKYFFQIGSEHGSNRQHKQALVFFP